jgi:hypothetical protein
MPPGNYAAATVLTRGREHDIVISMKKAEGLLRSLIVISILLIIYASATAGHAQEPSEPPERVAEIIISVTEYEWWVIRWLDNQILCRVLTDREGLPPGEDILRSCGTTVYNQWRATPPCPISEEDIRECPGVYLHQITSRAAERTIQVDLPSPSVWIALANCTPTVPDNRCPTIPNLLLTGEEPLPNEQITAIHVIMNGRTITCEGATCEVPLRPTPLEGITIEFWADSSFGDATQTYSARLRVIDSGVVGAPGAGGWYVDVISSQWRGRQVNSCAQTWQAFPPVGNPPDWLSTPEFPELLATDEPYYFLAGRLISRGLVDASSCPGGGLLPNGYADACGLERARSFVQEWQNQFDERIIEVAQETGVPGQLMKNLFAQESQFWPGAFNGTEHVGLGHITEKGTEVLLLWNRSFFDQFCPLVLHESACAGGYLKLDSQQQEMLRGALAMKAKAECPDCPAGIDLSHADFTVDLFAQTLLANCEQVAQVVYNASNRIAGTVSSYEDLWRFTLANYHAGPGCLSYAMHSSWARREPLTWDNVSRYLTPACQGVIEYVENVAE